MAEKRTKDSYRENQVRLDRLRAVMEADPQAFQELLSKISGKMLIPHSEGQKEVLTADERFLVLCAGRRWGKSQVGAAKALRRARNERQIIWWVAPTYKVVKRGYEAVIKQMPEGLLTKPAPPDSAFDAGRSVRLEFKNGSKMEFYSAERPEGMLGGSCDFLIMDEAATMPEHVWTQVIRATLIDRSGGALFISTPRGRNWFYNLYIKGQDPNEPEYRSWRFPSDTNPTLPPGEVESMAAELPLAMYEQEVLAQFISNAASVFRIDEETAIVEIEEPRGHVILGIDLAKHEDFSVLCGINAEDRKPCYHDRFNQVSWPSQRRNIHAAVDEILAYPDVTGITIVVDSTGVGDVMYDDLTEEGLDVIPIKFSPQWKLAAVQLLSADLERGNAFIHDGQLAEFQTYSYKINESGRWKFEAASGHDDEVSAALLAHWGVVHEGVPNIQTLTVNHSDIRAAAEEAAIEDTGLPEEPATKVLRPPTVQELMANPDCWL